MEEGVAPTVVEILCQNEVPCCPTEVQVVVEAVTAAVALAEATWPPKPSTVSLRFSSITQQQHNSEKQHRVSKETGTKDQHSSVEVKHFDVYTTEV